MTYTDCVNWGKETAAKNLRFWLCGLMSSQCIFIFVCFIYFVYQVLSPLLLFGFDPVKLTDVEESLSCGFVIALKMFMSGDSYCMPTQ